MESDKISPTADSADLQRHCHLPFGVVLFSAHDFGDIEEGFGSSAGRMMLWPRLEIGNSSEIPCRIPRITA